MAKGLVEFHEKAKSYDWDFTVGDKSPKYQTKYTIPAKGRDPFRMLIRDYMKMEAEKDDRTYGFLDGALRMGMAEKVEPLFNECLKSTLPDLTNAEFQAVAWCGGIVSHRFRIRKFARGYQAQMLDEIRHTQLQMSLRNYYVKHTQDPACWDIAQKAIYQHPGGLVSIGHDHFNTGDPVDCIVALNVVIEPDLRIFCWSQFRRLARRTAITRWRRRCFRSSRMNRDIWLMVMVRCSPSSVTKGTYH